MSTSISVIIPTYNRWQVLQRAIDSVLAQSVAADEIIVVDDGSSDNTCTRLQQAFGERITVLSQSNKGVSAARNAGIKSSIGNWIALLDSDDEWLPEKLQQQVHLLERNHNCVLCHTDEIWVRNGVRVNPMLKHKKTGGDIFAQCLPLCAISPSSVLIKKEIFETVGLFDESLPACEDYDLWLRICAAYPVHYLDDKLLIKYGGHEDQLSKKHWGMDRFRIKALHQLLTTTALSPEQRQLTTDMLEQKIHILLNGAIKHHNQELSDECYQLIARHNLNTPESLRC